MSVSTKKTLTLDAVQSHIKKATEGGLLTFWRISEPAKTRKLSTAVQTVKKDFANQPVDNRFVYFPDFRVAGTVGEIAQRLSSAGINQVTVGQLNQLSNRAFGDAPGTYTLDYNVIRNNSFDPLNPAHEALITAYVTQVRASQGKKVKPAREHYDFAMKTDILSQAYKASKSGAKAGSAGGEGSVAGGKTGKGGKGVANNRANRIGQFETFMNSVVDGHVSLKVLDVSKFDVTKFTGVSPKDAPDPARAHAFRPSIIVGGRQVEMPIIAQQAGFQNLQNYIENVVSASKYAQYAQPLKEALARRIGSGQVTVTAPLAPLVSALPQAPLQTSLPPLGTGALPTLSLPTLGSVSTSPVRTSVGSPGPVLTGRLSPPRTGLPTLGGMNLPTLPTLPTLQ